VVLPRLAGLPAPNGQESVRHVLSRSSRPSLYDAVRVSLTRLFVAGFHGRPEPGHRWCESAYERMRGTLARLVLSSVGSFASEMVASAPCHL
jgi:hypothetical protein